MRVDAYASQVHYWRHLAPLVDELRDRGHQVRTWSQQGQPWGPAVTPGLRPKVAPLLLIASHADAREWRDRHLVYVEHGAGQTYCLVPASRVLTADLRWKPIGEIQIGDGLVAFDEHRDQSVGRARSWAHAIVIGKRVIRRACYRIALADGSEITASADHLWLKRNRESFDWMRTEDLHDARRWPSRSTKLLKVTDVWDEDLSWGAAYLAAAFDGEGCLTQTRRAERKNRMMLTFTQKDNAMLAQVERELVDRGFSYSIAASRSDGVRYLTIKGGTREVLRLMGSVRPRRLLAGLAPMTNGQMRARPVEVLEVEPIGEREVVALETTTGTFLAEGFASHNCGLDHGFAGATGLDQVVLFVCPNGRVADRWRARYPDARAVAVGCPALDGLVHHRPSSDKPRVAVTCHWRMGYEDVPEGAPALPLYLDQVVDLAAGVEVIGHAHPRAATELARVWARLGIRFEPDPDVILQEADLLIGDNTSLLYEAALIGLPVLVLNAPFYRRDVEHGLRFWSHVPGLQCDEPTDFIGAVVTALADPPELSALRERAAAYAYAAHDRSASACAVDAILELEGAAMPPTGPTHPGEVADRKQEVLDRLYQLGATDDMVAQVREHATPEELEVMRRLNDARLQAQIRKAVAAEAPDDDEVEDEAELPSDEQLDDAAAEILNGDHALIPAMVGDDADLARRLFRVESEYEDSDEELLGWLSATFGIEREGGEIPPVEDEQKIEDLTAPLVDGDGRPVEVPDGGPADEAEPVEIEVVAEPVAGE